MTLQEILREIQHLSADERRHVRDFLDQLERDIQPHQASPEQRIREMREAAAAIREGMTQAEIDEMIEAMNMETPNPFDEDMWKD